MHVRSGGSTKKDENLFFFLQSVSQDLGLDIGAELDPEVEAGLDGQVDVGGNPDLGTDVDLGKSEVELDLVNHGLDTDTEFSVNVSLDFGNDRHDEALDLGIDGGDNGGTVLLKALESLERAELSNDGVNNHRDLGRDFGIQGSLDEDFGLGVGLGLEADFDLLNIDIGSKDAVEDVGVSVGFDNHVSAKV